MTDGRPAIKLPFEAGEHLCTWDLPDGDGGISPAPGLLDVEPGKSPSAVVYGKIPVKWQSGVASFPQRHDFDCLVGQLSSGAHVALMHGQLSYWVEDQGRAFGALAVISLSTMTGNAPPKFSSIQFQIEGIEAVVEGRPIASFRMPRFDAPVAGDRTWSATMNPKASWSWQTDGITMAVNYTHSVRAGDGYEFGMTSSPTIRLTSRTELTVAEWWEQWVMPLRRLVSVLTAAPRGVQYLFGLEGEDPKRLRKAQVFGLDIAQSPVNSISDEVRKLSSSVMVDTDEVNLLDLVVRWRELEEQRHPLLETYGDLATMRDQHPRSRFLLLVQALEGLHGYEVKDTREQGRSEHAAKRKDFLDRVAPSLGAADRKFLKKFLSRRPIEGLEADLIEILDGLPVDVRPELETLELTKQVRELDGVPDDLRVEAVLAKVRNSLSHGSSQFPPQHLDGAVKILERVARSETIRVLGAPPASRERALRKPER